MFKASFQELSKIRTIVVVALLAAISICLDLFKINIYLTPELKISFSYVFLAIGGMLYGPVVASLLGAIMDVCGHFVNPMGPYFLGFTLTAMAGGMIFGIFLYKKKITPVRVFTSKLIINFILNTILNTIFISILYGKYTNVLILPRFIKNIAVLPFEVLLLYFVLKQVERIYPKIFISKKRIKKEMQ